MKIMLLVVGFLLLFAAEILRVYFIMPFPGSQYSDTIHLAYWLDRNIVWLRLLGLLMIAWPAIGIFRWGKTWQKVVLCLPLLLYGLVFYMFNFRFEADRMFYQPRQKQFIAGIADTADADRLVIGVAVNGEARAYPIQVIGYHHQVRDTVGGVPIMVTYCTVCRTGRVFSPTVDGKAETFRLVGMDHFNAMFEDAGTKSWWRQATGEAIAGPLSGKRLQEIPSHQMRLGSWLRLYPGSLVLRPDPAFAAEYAVLKGYDQDTMKSSLEGRAKGSWQRKSWVVGVIDDTLARAYDWNALAKAWIIQDSLPGLPLAIALEKDGASFHAFSRELDGHALRFVRDPATGGLTDILTGSTWSASGMCLEGMYKGRQLAALPAYQEFWHSWKTFHPATTAK